MTDGLVHMQLLYATTIIVNHAVNSTNHCGIAIFADSFC